VRRTAPKSKRDSFEPDLFGFSASSLAEERDLIHSMSLSPAIAEWAAQYARVGSRGEYLWKWCERGARLTTLPSVASHLMGHICETKVLSIMLCVLLDDVADGHGSERFLDALLKIVDDPRPSVAGKLARRNRLYADTVRKLAQTYYDRLSKYPCHDVYRDLLRFDQSQFFNALKYSHLLNESPGLLNVIEHDLYLPHNMHMMSFATLDLMCSPGFSGNELGKLREAVWHTQCMGRIGNLLSSWQRECRCHDYTSGVFARAVETGDLSLEQLFSGDQQTIEAAIAAGGHERYFFDRWRHHRRCYKSLAAQIESIDLSSTLAAHDSFLRMHLASRGLI
jgi:hypothetical protein